MSILRVEASGVRTAAAVVPLYALFLTPFVVLMIETVEPTDLDIVLIRIGYTLLGGGIALAISYLLRPKSAFRS